MGRVTETHVGVAIVTMEAMNIYGEKIYFDAWTKNSEANLPLMRLRLRKYIELRENGAIAQRGRSLTSTIALFVIVTGSIN